MAPSWARMRSVPGRFSGLGGPDQVRLLGKFRTSCEEGGSCSFTIEELGVDLRVPDGSTGRVVFDAPAGTYEFVCTPHADVMKGKLVVE